MVPSFSEDATRAMSGQSKGLSQDYLSRNGGSAGNVILYVFISFLSRYVNFLNSQPSFCSAGLSFVLCSFGCLFGFRKINRCCLSIRVVAVVV